MPVYEYECDNCQNVFEVQQKIADPPLRSCPSCQGSVRKLMSMTSFQLKGGGWYADGYASAGDKPKEKTESTPAPPTPAPPCQTGAGCTGCPAAAATGK